MKDYKQVTQSVFKKAEQRIAEKKRRRSIIRRNVLAGAGIAAVLCVVLLQNDDIRSAIKSLPKLASSSWSNKSSKNSYTTTNASTTAVTTKKSHVTTKNTTAETTSETTTTTETTTTETETTTTLAIGQPSEETVATTAPPAPEKPSKIADKPLLYLNSLHANVTYASGDILELDDGNTISLEYGAEQFRNRFKAGDQLQYNANFVYDNGDDVYYFVDGYIEDSDFEYDPDTYQDEFTSIDTAPYEEYYGHKGQPFDTAPIIDYKLLHSYSNFSFKSDVYYKMEARNIKIASFESSYEFTTEDGQLWRFNSFMNMSNIDFRSLKPGDTISFAADFMYNDSDDVLVALAFVMKKES